MTRGALDDVLVGSSTVMRDLRHELAAIAKSQVSVLIEGETGTGKELVAQALHSSSGRTGVFVGLNVCAVGEGLFESEMFGHARGAFTGAYSSRSGRFREADGGTLFLDELGGLSLSCQAKLLRVLETGVVRPVGGQRDERVGARMISATNQSIAELVAASAFRSDLAFRLGQWRVHVPALRDRREDISALVRHFATGYSSAEAVLTSEVVDEISSLDWPGNVRQLRSFVQVLLAVRTGPVAREEVRALWLRTAWLPATAADGARDEREQLLTALRENEWRTDVVARKLGVHPSTLYRRLSRLGVRRPRGARRSTDKYPVARRCELTDLGDTAAT